MSTQTSSKVGGAVGGAVGAYAGQKAMEFVPFGLGSMFGNKVGKSLGEAAGGQMALSPEKVKAGSDLSFNNIHDMANWLVKTHGTHPQFQQAMQVAIKVYPELNTAYMRALNR